MTKINYIVWMKKHVTFIYFYVSQKIHKIRSLTMGLQEKHPIFCVDGVRKTFKIFIKYDRDLQIGSDAS